MVELETRMIWIGQFSLLKKLLTPPQKTTRS
jgi:hypothetical protein